MFFAFLNFYLLPNISHCSYIGIAIDSVSYILIEKKMILTSVFSYLAKSKFFLTVKF